MSPLERDKKVDKLLTMSKKEIIRLEVIQRIKGQQITQKQAAEQLCISVRQVKRIWKTYQEKGAEGLVHQRRGKPGNNQISTDKLRLVRDLIFERYSDFGPTLACEKLGEKHGVKISVERVRQLMISEGLWKAKRRRNEQVFQMRQRRACLGELIQVDGSDYDWFEGRHPRCTLLVFVDDATGKLVALRFVPHESFFAYCEAARSYFEQYGKPRAIYSDKHGIFHLNNPTALQGEGMTEFGRAMEELGVQIICANTPQAKGRVERANKTLQDRLTKELRLR
jgi:transposase